MPYCIFWPFLVVDSVFNFSTGFIDRDRFRQERANYSREVGSHEEKQRSKQRNSSHLTLFSSSSTHLSDLDENLEESEQEESGTSRVSSIALRLTEPGDFEANQRRANHQEQPHRSSNQLESNDEAGAGSTVIKLINNFNLLLKYNRFGLARLSLILIQILLLLFPLLKSIVYSFLASLQDHSDLAQVIRYKLNSFNVKDVFSIYKNSVQYNQLQLLVLLPLLVNRTRALIIQLKLARKNSNTFKSTSVISLNWAYLRNMMFTTKYWLNLLTASISHKCKPGTCFHEPEEFVAQDKRINYWDSDRIGRLYYFNQISFDRCYGSLLVNCHHKVEDEKLPPAIVGWFVKLVDDGRNWFVASPAHRINLHHIFYLITVLFSYIIIFSLVNTIILIARLVTYISCLRESTTSREIHNSEPGGSPKVGCSNIESLFDLIITMSETFLTELLIDLNICDSIMFFANTMIHYSRILRVVEILDGQLSIYNSHIRDKFGKKWNNSQTNGIDSGKSSEPFQRSYLKRGKTNSDGYSDFNDNIDHSLNLCDVILCEFDDLKRHYNFYLSIYTVLSTFSSAYSVIMILSLKSTAELVAIWGRLFTCVVPLLCGLFMGALVESGVSFRTLDIPLYRCISFESIVILIVLSCYSRFESQVRKMYRALTSLLVNEIRLMNDESMDRMAKLVEYLGVEENRSFVLAGNIPLTAGTFVPVIGWICTCSLMLQRFLWDEPRKSERL